MHAARALEEVLIDEYPGDDRTEELLYILSLYSPGIGVPYSEASDVRPWFFQLEAWPRRGWLQATVMGAVRDPFPGTKSSHYGPRRSVDTDYFWSIPPDAIYDVYEQPSELTIGQLTESMDNVRSVTANPEDAISYALVWMGDVLRATGHKLVSWGGGARLRIPTRTNRRGA